jgi:hypothetical protein
MEKTAALKLLNELLTDLNEQLYFDALDREKPAIEQDIKTLESIIKYISE